MMGEHAVPDRRDGRRPTMTRGHLLEAGEYEVTFLGADFVTAEDGTWAMFTARFRTDAGEERVLIRNIVSGGSPTDPFPVINLWRALGAGFFDMRGGRYPSKEEWAPYVGRRLGVTVRREIGRSGREFMNARWWTR